MAAPETILQRWRDRDLFINVDGVGVRVELETPKPHLLGMLRDRHAAQLGRPLPPLLDAFLERFNGFSVRETADPDARVVTLEEVDVCSGLAAAEMIEHDEVAGTEIPGLVIGRAFQGPRILLVDSGAVYFEDDEPRQVADDLPDLFLRLVDYGLSLDSLVFADDADEHAPQ